MNGIIQVNLQQSSRGVMKFFIDICMYILGGGGEGREGVRLELYMNCVLCELSLFCCLQMRRHIINR